MPHFLRHFTLFLIGLLTMTGNALAMTAGDGATAVPEPSAALLGGLCGILFLLWRKK